MGGVLGGDLVEGLADGGQERVVGAGLGGAQKGFNLAPHQFDGVEVGRVGGQELDAGAGGADQREGLVVFVRAEVVHDHHIAGAQRWVEHFAHVGAEDVGVGGRLDGQAGGRAVQADRGDHGGGAPVAVRALRQQALAAGGPAAQARQVGFGRRLIEKDQPRGIPAALAAAPPPPRLHEVRPILLGGAQRFF